MTYTVAILEVAQSTYDDIKQRIEKINENVGGNQYGHMFLSDGGIDLTHIAVKPERVRKAKTAAELKAQIREWLDSDDATHWGDFEKELDDVIGRHE